LAVKLNGSEKMADFQAWRPM
jgi:hypothetical protein